MLKDSFSVNRDVSVSITNPSLAGWQIRRARLPKTLIMLMTHPTRGNAATAVSNDAHQMMTGSVHPCGLTASPTIMPSIPGRDQTPYWFSMYPLDFSASSAGQPNWVRPSHSWQ